MMQSHAATLNQICFVYSNLGAPTRYRVWHQIEQMHSLGLNVRAFSIEDVDAQALPIDYDLLYLYRLPWSYKLKEIIHRAHQQGRPVILDVDDYVWDPALRQHCYLDHFSIFEIYDLLAQRDRFSIVMKLVDGLVVSTPYLAHLVQQQFQKPVFVNPNAVSVEMVNLSAKIYASREPNIDTCCLGYFSGYKGHTIDFELIIPSINAIMLRYPYVDLKIVGLLDLNLSKFDPLIQNRIQFVEPVDWQQLLPTLSTIDINLAPLVDTPYNRSKSAVKFLEAALVGVPTIASNLEPYQEIVSESTGMLAETPAEWYQALKLLIESPLKRMAMGEAARNYVLSHHPTSIRAENLGRILNEFATCSAVSPWSISLKDWWNIFRWLPLNIPRRAYQMLIPLRLRLYLRNQRWKLMSAVKTTGR